MSVSKTEFRIPDSPTSLRDIDFLSQNFTVDGFLQNFSIRRNSSLEALQEDLELYLLSLKASMIELINEDYGDFVDLSGNLVGTEVIIQSQLVEPFKEISNVLEGIYREAVNLMRGIQGKLKERNEIRRLKALLPEFEALSCGLGKIERLLVPYSLERIATEIKKLQFSKSKIPPDSQFLINILPRIIRIQKDLKENLEKELSDSLTQRNFSSVKRVLAIYGTLEMMSEAETFLSNSIVAPSLERILSAKSFAESPKGLGGLLDSLLIWINSLTGLLDIPQSGFDFILHCFWPIFILKLSSNLPFIFFPGNPESFFSNYSTSMDFLKKLENKVKVSRKLWKIRIHSDFISQWNLQIYFTIRFREIGAPFEESLRNFFIYTESKEDFHLLVSRSLFDSLTAAWNSKSIYLSSLSPKFLKLSFQILSRFNFELARVLEMTSEESISSSKSGSPSLESWTHLWYDLQNLLSSSLPILLSSTILPQFSEEDDEETKTGVEKAFSESFSLLQYSQSRLCQNKILGTLVENGKSTLSHLSELPRLYRRTNKEIPTRVSPYMESTTEPLTFFYNSNKDVIQECRDWMVFVINSLSTFLFSLVQELINSGIKMEESLKRLGRLKEKMGDVKEISDEDKIRWQLRLDIEYFESVMKGYGIEKESWELKALLMHATRSIEEQLKKGKTLPKRLEEQSEISEKKSLAEPNKENDGQSGIAEINKVEKRKGEKMEGHESMAENKNIKEKMDGQREIDEHEKLAEQ